MQWMIFNHIIDKEKKNSDKGRRFEEELGKFVHVLYIYFIFGYNMAL